MQKTGLRRCQITHRHTHTRIVLAHEKWNSAICSNMNGPRNSSCFSDISQIKTNTEWCHLYVESKKTIQMKAHAKQKQIHRYGNKPIVIKMREKYGEGQIGAIALTDTYY